jgi:hypothetical protein
MWAEACPRQLLQPDDRYPRLGAVDPESVPEIVDRHVGPEGARGVPTAVVELRRERRGLEEAAGPPVVIERCRKYEICGATREPGAVRGELFYPRRP